MKKILIAFAAIVLFSISLTSVARNNSNDKITVCHRTGNGESHPITISINALPAHLAHGDSIGDCTPPSE